MFDDLTKKATAQDRIRKLDTSGSIVISTQVLNEVFSTAIRKFKADPIRGRELVRDMSKHKCVVVDLAIIDRAIDIHILEQISYLDALMLSAAISANCTTLLTENLTHGQVIQGIRIENPFA